MDKQQLFNELKEKHPDWSDEQIWTTISVMLSSEDAITASGPGQLIRKTFYGQC